MSAAGSAKSLVFASHPILDCRAITASRAGYRSLTLSLMAACARSSARMMSGTSGTVVPSTGEPGWFGSSVRGGMMPPLTVATDSKHATNRSAQSAIAVKDSARPTRQHGRHVERLRCARFEDEQVTFHCKQSMHLHDRSAALLVPG